LSILLLTLSSFASWFLSTLAGGGTPLLLVPAIAFYLGAPAVPPVLTIGMLLGHPQRVFLYWKEINWLLMWWYFPGAVVGAILGAFAFTQIQLNWLPIFLAVFLIISAIASSFNEKFQTFSVRAWYFLPAGFIFAFLSGLIGSAGPILNPLYLNYGLSKEQTIATKSAHLLAIHIVKTITYLICGVLTLNYLGFGVLLGLAALPGNWLGQIVLQKIAQQQFNRIAIAFIAFSGILILGNEFLWGNFFSDQ
jgi:uncharacterized membrane protein YfcA